MSRTVTLPADLKYTKSHEWARVEGTVATVGITAYAVSQINEVIFLELPQTGKVVSQNTPFGSIESVKAVFDLYSPATGTVIEVNSGLNEHVDTITKDPYGAGWMIKIALSPPQDLRELFDARGYEAHIASESSH